MGLKCVISRPEVVFQIIIYFGQSNQANFDSAYCKVSAQYTYADWTGAATAIATAALQNHTDQLSQLGSHIWIWCW